MQRQGHSPDERRQIDIGRRGVNRIASEDEETRDLTGFDGFSQIGQGACVIRHRSNGLDGADRRSEGTDMGIDRIDERMNAGGLLASSHNEAARSRAAQAFREFRDGWVRIAERPSAYSQGCRKGLNEGFEIPGWKRYALIRTSSSKTGPRLDSREM